MNQRLLRFTCSIVSVLVMILSMGSTVALAEGPRHNDHDETLWLLPKPPVLELKPGESGHLTIMLTDGQIAPKGSDQANASVMRLEIEGINSNQVLGSASCSGSITGYGPAGNKLWRWQSIQFYNYNGSIVNLESNRGTPTIYYLGWSFDHSSYINAGSGTWYANAISAGYFKYLGGVQRKVGYVTFDIYGNGTCYVGGFSGDW
jgi:hypothetical protein